MLATRFLSTGAFMGLPVPDDAGLAPFELVAVPGGGWTWFNAPNAIHVDGRTYFGYITGGGHPYAAYYEHAGATVSTPVRLYPSQLFEVDDHDDPGLVVRSSDDAIIAYFSTHFGDDQYHNVWNGSTWSGPTNIGSAIAGGKTTYMNPVELPDGTIRVFFRDHFDEVNPEWAYADSANGTSFTGHTSFVRESGVITYVKPFMGSDGRIDFVASGHPAYDSGGSIWHFYWDEGSYYQSDGTLIESSLPLDTGDMTKVYDGTTTKGWLWDIARIGDDLAIVFATFPGNDGDEHHYQYARWTGSWDVHEVVDGGTYIPTAAVAMDPVEVFYSGGIAIDRLDIDRVYASVQTGPGRWDIIRYITDDGGETWDSLAYTDDSKNVRPKAVRDPDPELRVVWMRGTYSSYVSYSVATWGAG